MPPALQSLGASLTEVGSQFQKLKQDMDAKIIKAFAVNNHLLLYGNATVVDGEVVDQKKMGLKQIGPGTYKLIETPEE